MGSLDLPFFCPQVSWIGDTTGTSLTFDVGEYRRIRAVLDVSYLGGATPDLACTVEGSLDRLDWHTIAAFAIVDLMMTPFDQVLAFSSQLRYVRAKAVLHSPSSEDPGQAFFSIKGIASD